MEVALTPVQHEVLDRLRAPGRARPSFPAELRAHLRARLEQELAPVAATLERPLWVTKAALARVHACESHHLAVEQAPFGWSVATARGVVVHKAIELSVHVRRPAPPLQLVDAALERLAEDAERDVGRWLHGLPEAERAELRAAANDVVAKFSELFPPLRPAWRPRTESGLRVDLADGRIVLRGRVDLTLGVPQGTVAGRLVLDLKTGAPAPADADDLRFYALLDTLVVGVPPFRLASCYLSSGRLAPEDVSEATLEAAVRRTVQGVRRLAELRAGRRAEIRPNPACRWCPGREGCDGARAWDEAGDERWAAGLT